jgi:hypothetical protein
VQFAVYYIHIAPRKPLVWCDNYSDEIHAHLFKSGSERAHRPYVLAIEIAQWNVSHMKLAPPWYTPCALSMSHPWIDLTFQGLAWTPQNDRLCGYHGFIWTHT